jgi:hypothetical protein
MAIEANRRFSATLSNQDLAVIGCLMSLAEFIQQIGDMSKLFTTYERDWRVEGQKVTFRFSAAPYRDLFINEVRRLLPANCPIRR